MRVDRVFTINYFSPAYNRKPRISINVCSPQNCQPEIYYIACVFHPYLSDDLCCWCLACDFSVCSNGKSQLSHPTHSHQPIVSVGWANAEIWERSDAQIYLKFSICFVFVLTLVLSTHTPLHKIGDKILYYTARTGAFWFIFICFDGHSYRALEMKTVMYLYFILNFNKFCNPG